MVELLEVGVDRDQSVIEFNRAIWDACVKTDSPQVLGLMSERTINSMLDDTSALYEYGSARVYERLLDTVWSELSDELVIDELYSIVDWSGDDPMVTHRYVLMIGALMKRYPNIVTVPVLQQYLSDELFALCVDASGTM